MTIEFKIIPAYQAVKAAELNAETTLGIEVTVPAVAVKCGLGNIDHHGEGCTSETPSACEQALNYFLPPALNPEEASRQQRQNDQWFNIAKTVVGNIPDADTLTAFAIIKIASDPRPYFRGSVERTLKLGILAQVVNMVGAVDRIGAASATDQDGKKYAQHSLVKTIRAISGSRTLGLDHQILMVMDIIMHQEVHGAAKKAVEESDKLFAAAKEASKVTVLDSGIVLVESSHHAATRIGYEHGDVLVCLNEKMMKDFKNKDAGTYRKFTVCKRDENVQAVINFDRLNELEEANGTWGGRSTVGGSPQGVDSTLTVEQVASCIDLQ